MIPLPTTCDQDALTCTELCYADSQTGGNSCTDSPEQQVVNVSHVLCFVRVQLAKTPPTPACKDKNAELNRFFQQRKAGRTAETFDWAAILQLLLTLLTSLLGGLAPPTPAPVP
jgi:hypothetical protein